MAYDPELLRQAKERKEAQEQKLQQEAAERAQKERNRQITELKTVLRGAGVTLTSQLKVEYDIDEKYGAIAFLPAITDERGNSYRPFLCKNFLYTGLPALVMPDPVKSKPDQVVWSEQLYTTGKDAIKLSWDDFILMHIAEWNERVEAAKEWNQKVAATQTATHQQVEADQREIKRRRSIALAQHEAIMAEFARLHLAWEFPQEPLKVYKWCWQTGAVVSESGKPLFDYAEGWSASDEPDARGYVTLLDPAKRIKFKPENLATVEEVILSNEDDLKAAGFSRLSRTAISVVGVQKVALDTKEEVYVWSNSDKPAKFFRFSPPQWIQDLVKVPTPPKTVTLIPPVEVEFIPVGEHGIRAR